MEFQSPGAAFTNSFDDSLTQRALMQRQQMLDQLNAKKEADLATYRQAEVEAGKQALQEKHDEHVQAMESSERDRTRKDVLDLMPGDDLNANPELKARIEKYQIPVRMTQTPPPPIQGTAAMQGTPGAGAPITPQEPPPALAAPLPQVYGGNRQQVEKAAQDAKVKGLIDRMSGMDPASPEFRSIAAEYEMTTGKAIPTGMVKSGSGGNGEAIMRQHPTTGAVEQMVGGQWQPFTGDTAPDKAHWITTPPPKDNSGAEDRKSKQVDTIREKGYSETKDFAKPLLAQISSVEGLSTALSQNSNVADSVIAPMVLKATVSGTGSGFRMTQAEINNVLKGTRSNWESLSLTLNKWSSSGGLNPDGSVNPKVPLVLDEDQRVAIRKLARAIRQSAVKQYKKVTDADDALGMATSVEEVNRIRTRLKKDIVPEDDPTDDSSGASGNSVPAVGGMFNGGKVLKVTPIK